MKSVDGGVEDEAFPPRPRWLEDDELAAQLLGRFLDQLDRGTRPYLRITPKNAAQLYDFQNEDVDSIWALISSLEEESQVLTIKLSRIRPDQQPYEQARVYLNPDKEALVRHWLNRPAVDPYHREWERAVASTSSQFDDCGRALLQTIIHVTDKQAEDVVRAFARIRDELRQPTTLRALSARCFWGDSKFLDNQEELVRALFPARAQNLQARPLLLTVCLPETMERVLFVENQDSFLALSQQGLPGYALVYSAGFRGSAARVRLRGNAVFSYLNGHRRPAARQFEDWWFEHSENGQIHDQTVPCQFWGDLDFSGMTILKALRTTFTGIGAWEAGYAALLRLVLDGDGHANDFNSKGNQKDPGETGCHYADSRLLPAIRATGTFIDQEALRIAALLPLPE